MPYPIGFITIPWRFFNDDVVDVEMKNKTNKNIKTHLSITPYSDYKSRMYLHSTYGFATYIVWLGDACNLMHNMTNNQPTTYDRCGYFQTLFFV